MKLDEEEKKGLEERVKGIGLPKVMDEDVDNELETTERGRIVGERRSYLEEYERFKEEQQWGTWGTFIGISLFILGSYTLIIPLYKVICERMGFSTKTGH